MHVALAVVVAMLFIYPSPRSMRANGGQQAVTPPTAGARELQASFEHYQAGRYQEAVAAAKAALAANPDSADAYNNLAVSYMGLHQIDEAIKAVQEAIRLRPDYHWPRTTWPGSNRRNRARLSRQPRPHKPTTANNRFCITRRSVSPNYLVRPCDRN
jgi:tetratricopeptide (TPR) repeat protein